MTIKFLRGIQNAMLGDGGGRGYLTTSGRFIHLCIGIDNMLLYNKPLKREQLVVNGTALTVVCDCVFDITADTERLWPQLDVWLAEWQVERIDPIVIRYEPLVVFGKLTELGPAFARAPGSGVSFLIASITLSL